MSTPKRIRIGFEKKAIELPLSAILPIRQVKPSDASFGKYRAVLASIRTVGLVEPMVVYPNRASRGTYLLLDGHLRLKALGEIGIEKALCLISTEDDAFTYNDKVSGISLIQEHRMILKALEGGVTEEQIAKALDIDIKTIMSRKRMLEGIHPEAVQLLKAKPISERTLVLLKNVKSLRQIEMAQLMVSGNNYSYSYVRALLVGTNREHLVKPDEPQKIRSRRNAPRTSCSPARAFPSRAAFALRPRPTYPVLHLSTAQRYVRRLIDNAKVKRFLNQRHPEILEELQELAALESL